MDDKAPQSTQQVLRRCAQVLLAALPSGWEFAELDEVPLGTRLVDAIFTLTDPTGNSIQFVVEAKRSVERRDLGRIQERLDKYIQQLNGRAQGLVVARYLSPQVRAALEEVQLAYIDSTGNMRIAVEQPTIFVSVRVTDKDPWRQPGRPRGTLKGEPAARVVRTLADYTGPLFISDILKFSGASTGPTYRVRDYLMEEGLLKRNQANSAYLVPDWQKLLREWAGDYAIAGLNTTRSYIAPRGIESLRSQATSITGFRYAVTGSVAASEWAPYSPARAAMIYVENTERAAESLDLRPTDVGQNIILIEPKSPDSIVFENTRMTTDGITLASPSQVVVDLLTGPGRNPAEGEALMRWMAANEKAWRK